MIKFSNVVKVFIFLILVLGSYQIYLIYLDEFFDALDLNLNPSLQERSVVRGENFELRADLGIKVKDYCNLKCFYELTSSGGIRDADNFSVLLNDDLEFLFEEKISNYGFGKYLYSLDVKCVPDKTLGCSDDFKETADSALFIVNFEPNKQDILLLDNFRKDYFDLAKLDVSSLKYYDFVLESKNISKIKLRNLDEFLLLIRLRLNHTQSVFDEFSSLWVEQNPNVIEGVVSKDEMIFAKETEFKIKSKYLEINSLITSYNYSVEAARSILNKSHLIDSISFNVVFLGNNYSYLWKSKYDWATNDIRDLNYGGVYNYSFILENLEEFNVLVDEYSYLFFEDVSDRRDLLVESFLLSNDSSVADLFYNNISWYDNSCIYFDNLSFSDNYSGFSWESRLDDFYDLFDEPINFSYNKSLDAFNYTVVINNINNFLGVCNSRKKLDLLPELDSEEIDFRLKNLSKDYSLPDPGEICCANNGCFECDFEPKIPLIMLHGHSFNKNNRPEYNSNIFNDYVENFDDRRYYHAGLFNIENGSMGVLSGFDKPFLFRYSYYLDSVLGEDKISNEASISEYSERLDFFIDNVLNLTGANKVDILAHSMGGLVSRKYVLDNGPEKINNMILVGTPNNGITKTISNVCPVFGSKRECDEMKKDSDFILALNSNVNNTLVDNTYLFGGVGCFLDGFASDGVVILPNLNLTGVPLILINMSCSKMNFIHNDLLNPEIFPSIYTSIENILFE